MPVTITMSKASSPGKDLEISAETERRVLDAIDTAQRYLLRAMTVIGTVGRLTPFEEYIWNQCFLAPSTDASKMTVFNTLFNTLTGISKGHKVKLAEGAYASAFGSIHVPYKLFAEAEPGNENRRVWQYIHEATHKFAGTVDAGLSVMERMLWRDSKVCYFGDEVFYYTGKLKYRVPGLTPKNTLNNADSITAFVMVTSLWQTGTRPPRFPMEVVLGKRAS